MVEIKKPRAVLLYRTSSKQQVSRTDDGEDDIPMQRNCLTAWAEREGYEIVEEFLENAVSGYRVSADRRDAIQKIKGMADRAEFEILGIYMSDRLGRIAAETPLIVSYLNARGIKIISFKEGPIGGLEHTDSLLTYIRYWQAEGESIKTSMRSRDGILESVKDGRWRGGDKAYGYHYVSRGTRNPKGKPILDYEINPDEAEVVKKIFSLYVEDRYGTRMITKWLNDSGIPTSKGFKWGNSSICMILRNKLYTGIYVYLKKQKDREGFEVSYPHLQIIDETTWQAAQIRLQENGEKINVQGRRKPMRHGSLLLTGLLYCGECGEKLGNHHARQRLKNKPNRIWKYYKCSRSIRNATSQPPCRPAMWQQVKIDDIVIRHTKKLVKEIDLTRLAESHRSDAEARLKAAKKEVRTHEQDVAKSEKEIKRLKDEVVKALLGESSFSQETLSDILKTKETEHQTLLTRIAKVREELEQLTRHLDTKLALADELLEWDTKFDAATESNKKLMMQNIIESITVHKDKLVIRLNVDTNPFHQITLAARQKLATHLDPATRIVSDACQEAIQHTTQAQQSNLAPNVGEIDPSSAEKATSAEDGLFLYPNHYAKRSTQPLKDGTMI